MRCMEPHGTHWRGALSAMLDGEDPGVDVAAVHAHLESCAACSRWWDDATSLRRTLQLLPVVERELGERLVNDVDVHLCACRTGGACLCGDCQCGPECTCHGAHVAAHP